MKRRKLSGEGRCVAFHRPLATGFVRHNTILKLASVGLMIGSTGTKLIKQLGSFNEVTQPTSSLIWNRKSVNP